MIKLLKRIFLSSRFNKYDIKGENHMSNVKATMSGNVLTVSTGTSKSFRQGGIARDSKLGHNVTFVGKAPKSSLKCPYIFFDNATNETRRHSAAYISKYIA